MWLSKLEPNQHLQLRELHLNNNQLTTVEALASFIKVEKPRPDKRSLGHNKLTTVAGLANFSRPDMLILRNDELIIRHLFALTKKVPQKIKHATEEYGNFLI